MADIDFAPTKTSSAEVISQAHGRVLDANTFDVDLAVRYHDHCQGVQRVNSFDQDVRRVIPAFADMGVKEAGIKFQDMQDLLSTLNTTEGKAKLEGMIKDEVSPRLADLCLTTDGVELRHVHTGK